jgi:hypothetical protein
VYSETIAASAIFNAIQQAGTGQDNPETETLPAPFPLELCTRIGE